MYSGCSEAFSQTEFIDLVTLTLRQQGQKNIFSSHVHLYVLKFLGVLNGSDASTRNDKHVHVFQTYLRLMVVRLMIVMVMMVIVSALTVTNAITMLLDACVA